MTGIGPGDVLMGRYRIERSLAQGGMAEVFVARDLRLVRPVAVKVLSSSLLGDPSFVERFRREARAAARLSHPGIVAIYDWGETGDSYFIVMEYVPGRTLAEIISAEAPLTADRAAGIGAQVAAALSAAHRNGVVHRDIKPSNVIVSPDGRATVTDFGIASTVHDSASRLTRTGTVLGTPTYLSPEQAQGGPVDGQSDVYSLGVVLYEMVTGTPPFQGDSMSVAYQHTRQPVDPPRVRNPTVPTALESIITQALAKSPADRQPDAQALHTQLAAFAGHSDSASTATVPMQRTLVSPAQPRLAAAGTHGSQLWQSRWVILLAALAVAAAAVIVILVAQGRGSPARGGPSTSHPPPNAVVTTSRPPATTTSQAPTSFPGYQMVAGSGATALFCPTGVELGQAGQTAPAPPGQPGGGAANGSNGSNGKGGPPGCGSNGGNGGAGGGGAPGGAGGAGGDGGAGGCQPATLTVMRRGARPCSGTGSNGGNGGNGGNAAPQTNGGNGGAGGSGGQTSNAKGGNGGNGGNAKPGVPGGDGEPGGSGGGSNGIEAGVNGQAGTPGTGA